MTKRYRLAGALLAVALALTACRSTPPQTPPAPPPPVAIATPPEPAGPAAPRSVADWVQYMTLEEKVGQLLWVALEGPAVSPEAERLLAAGQVGGFVFFAGQGSDPQALSALTGKLQGLVRSRERFTPGLAVSIDYEGGKVVRLAPNFTAWPGNMAIGATGSEQYAEQVYRAMARELLAAGINTNLAPDADVNNNPANPVIGVRSFGEDPGAVARMVIAAVKGLQAEGAAAVAKHFPGHGDTAVDSHQALPVVPHDLSRLGSVEFVPFKAAIVTGVDAVMAAHVVFPAVATDGNPATLSQPVLTGLLKEQMGFQGVVMTDAIDTMKAITDHYSLGKALVMAVQAGADVLLTTGSFGRQAELHSLLVEAVKDGRIPAARLDDAVRRNLAFKARRGLLPMGPLSAYKPPAAPPVSEVGSAAHRQLALQVGADALTLVRNKHLPLKLSADQQVLVVGPEYGAAATGVEGVSTALGAGVKAAHANTVETTLDWSPSAAGIARVRQLAARAAVIVYGVSNARSYPEHQALIRELIGTGKPVIVVGLGEPYDLTRLPQVQTYIAAYGWGTANMQGVGALLFGQAPPRGKLPVSIPGLYPLGHGLAY